jgi:hypothetical protein
VGIAEPGAFIDSSLTVVNIPDAHRITLVFLLQEIGGQTSDRRQPRLLQKTSTRSH